jgi:hypothetical protein
MEIVFILKGFRISAMGIRLAAGQLVVAMGRGEVGL